MRNTLRSLKAELKKHANAKKAKALQRFFKTGKGEYGEGDIFLGITVPEQREIAKNYYAIKLEELQKLINSKIHEERMICLFILIEKYKKELWQEKIKIYEFYLKNAKQVNNWDLVDLSAPNIVGNYLIDKDREVLYKLAKSDNLWKKRIAILSCFSFIRNNEFDDAIKLAKILLYDKHDLMHKAVGWMLREIGNRDISVEESFLRVNYKNMPRTMLRYAIEKFPEDKRLGYLNGDF